MKSTGTKADWNALKGALAARLECKLHRFVPGARNASGEEVDQCANCGTLITGEEAAAYREGVMHGRGKLYSIFLDDVDEDIRPPLKRESCDD